MNLNIKDNLFKEQVLQSAIELYQKHGLKKVSMNDIAKAIGKSRSSLYYYFENRDEVLEAVMFKIINEVTQEIFQSIQEAKSTKEKLQAFCLSKVKTNNEKRAIFSAMESGMDIYERSVHQKMKFKFHRHLMMKESELLQNVILSGIKNNEIRSIPIKEQQSLIFIIQTSIRGIRREMTYTNNYSNLKSVVSSFIEIISPWLEK